VNRFILGIIVGLVWAALADAVVDDLNVKLQNHHKRLNRLETRSKFPLTRMHHIHTMDGQATQWYPNVPVPTEDGPAWPTDSTLNVTD
jgi:hypothetical protein